MSAEVGGGAAQTDNLLSAKVANKGIGKEVVIGVFLDGNSRRPLFPQRGVVVPLGIVVEELSDLLESFCRAR